MIAVPRDFFVETNIRDRKGQKLGAATIEIAEVLYAGLDRTPGPHPFLRDKVKAGKLGMKTGAGMHSWTPETADAVRARLSRFLAAQAKAKARKASRS